MIRRRIPRTSASAPPAARDDWSADVAAFRNAMLGILTSDLARSCPPEVAAECAEMARLLDQCRSPVRAPQADMLPCAQFLARALDTVEPGPLQTLARAVAAIADGLQWRNKYKTSSAHLYDNFGFCDLVGPDGVQSSDQVTLGLVIVGPQTHYPLHHHPARELYLVLAGAADWAAGDGPFLLRPPGTFILHSEMQPHAMQTSQDTLLAVSLWRGDIRSPSRFSGPEF